MIYTEALVEKQKYNVLTGQIIQDSGNRYRVQQVLVVPSDDAQFTLFRIEFDKIGEIASARFMKYDNRVLLFCVNLNTQKNAYVVPTDDHLLTLH